MDTTIKVRVETIDGSAVETEDYIRVNEVLTFEPGEREKEVRLVLFGLELFKIPFTWKIC